MGGREALPSGSTRASRPPLSKNSRSEPHSALVATAGAASASQSASARCPVRVCAPRSHSPSQRPMKAVRAVGTGSMVRNRSELSAR
ncbi:hypothetical protein [Halomonas shengliensis]|uniref:hypothetical protein n=1 Tax=Halomonas shengliensis TaxID=419597 RepID=UPI001FDFFF7A|nr:hypothetical protein [Halomonas shengliensis]